MEKDLSSRSKIIEGAITVFAQHNYEKASTTMIAQTAGLSKGLIFHYFGSKADLFLATYQEVATIIIDRIVDKINYAETDMLLRLRESIWLKLEVMQTYPEIFEFLKAAYFEHPPELKERMQLINSSILDQGTAKIYQNIDYSRFRDDIDPRLAINTIHFTLEKWSENYNKELFQAPFDRQGYEEAFSKIDSYLALFRKCFYKEAV